MNRHERRAASAHQKKQKRAAQAPFDAIARRIEKSLGLEHGRLRLTLAPVSPTEQQYQLFAEPRLEGEKVALIQELLAAELGKYSKARGGTVDGGTVVPDKDEGEDEGAHDESR